MRHECYTYDASAKWVKKIDFGNDTNENIFLQLYIRYIANERLKGEKQFHSKNYFLQNALFPCQNALQKCTTKTELCNGKSYIKKLCARLYPIKGENFIAWLPLFREMLGNIRVVTLHSLDCDIINFQIYFFFLIKPFFLHDQKIKTKL